MGASFEERALSPIFIVGLIVNGIHYRFPFETNKQKITHTET